MKRTFLLIALFLMISLASEVKCQDLNQMTPVERGLFLQGYWKYVNPENEELLIVKIKALRRKNVNSENPYFYIGSYLYINNGLMINDNLSELNPYLMFTTWKEYCDNQTDDSILAIPYGWMINDLGQIGARMSFNDHSRLSDGDLVLTILSVQSGSEQLSWKLDLGEGVILIEEQMTDEEIEHQYCSFSVPQNIVLTKIHNLREFSNRGIILDPIPEVLE